jgi:hemerythrin-like domain-containing protein
MNSQDHLPAVDFEKVSSVSILAGEHEVILQTLSCLEKINQGTQISKKIPTEHVLQILEILKLFADKCHHMKEEDILFPALEEKNPNFTETAEMRAEHVQGREYIANMTLAVDQNVADVFVENSNNYIELLRQHIIKENDIIFRIAQDTLSETEDQEIVNKYRVLEHEDMGSGTHERLLDQANNLASYYDIPIVSKDPVIMNLLTAVCMCKKETKLFFGVDQSLEKVYSLSKKVELAHGTNHPKVKILAEKINYLTLTNPSQLAKEVLALGDEIKALTDDYTPWPKACNSVHTLFGDLKSLVKENMEVLNAK